MPSPYKVLVKLQRFSRCPCPTRCVRVPCTMSVSPEISFHLALVWLSVSKLAAAGFNLFCHFPAPFPPPCSEKIQHLFYILVAHSCTSKLFPHTRRLWASKHDSVVSKHQSSYDEQVLQRRVVRKEQLPQFILKIFIFLYI